MRLKENQRQQDFLGNQKNENPPTLYVLPEVTAANEVSVMYSSAMKIA